MNLPKLRRVNFKRLISALFLMLLVITPGRMIWGTTETSSVDDIIFLTPGDGSVEITFKLTGDVDNIKPVFLESPARLIYDFPNTILVYNNGLSRKFPVEVGDLNAVGVAQFQRNPDILRCVLYFKGGSQNDILKAIKADSVKGKYVITYSSSEKSSPVQPESLEGKPIRITKLLHQRVGPERDRFTFKGSNSFADPQVKFVSGGVVLSFKGVEFDVPAKAGKEYQVPVSGSFIEEIQIVNQTEGTVLYLRIKESARLFSFNTQFERISESELRFDLLRSYAVAEEETLKPKPVMTPEGKVAGLVQVLGAEMGSGESKYEGSGAKIIRIQYQPLSIGERFIIEALGNFKPVIEKLKYPDRLSLVASDTSVVLPKGAEDRFQVKIEGALSKLMKVFVREIEGKTESVIQFYYEISENEDIQYKFYATEAENVYNLDLLPVALEQSLKPQPEPVNVPKPKEKAPVNVEKPAAPPIAEKESVATEKATEKKEPSEETKKPDLVAFKIPTVDERAPLVEIPKAELESQKDEGETAEKKEESAVSKTEEVKEETTKVAKPVEIPKKAIEEPTPIKPVPIPKEKIDEVKALKPIVPKEKVKEIKPAEPEKPPVPATPKYAPVIVQFERVDNNDRFVITSDDPIENYSRAEMNYPTRLAIEFPGREVKYGGLKPGVNHYIKGKATESVRIIKQDYPSPRSIFFINLNQGWDNTECSMSGSPNRIVVDVVRIETEESTMIAKATEEGIAKVEIQQIEEKTEAATPSTQEPVVEKEPALVPEQKDEEQVEKVDELNFVIEEPQVTGDTGDLTFLVDKDKELKVAEEEKQIEEKVVETKQVETVKPVEPVKPEIEEQPTKPETEKQPIKPEIHKDEFIKIKVAEVEKEESGKDEELIAMFHPPDATPLKKGEILKPANCIGSINLNPDVALGQLTISSTGAYLPQPEIKWFNYPSRLSFIFEDVGINMPGAKQPDNWEQSIDSKSISKIQAIQESGGQVPLTATAMLYLKPGYDRTNIETKIEKLGDNSVRIDLVEIPKEKVAESQPSEPVKVEVVETPGEELKLKDLEEKPAVEKPAEVKEIPVEKKEAPPIAVERPGEKVLPEVKVEKPATKEAEPLVTIVLQNADIEDVLFLIAENTDIDISVESKAIRGTISMKVTRQPISEVFNLISNQGNFKWNKYKDIYVFGSEDFIWSFPGVIKPKVIRLKYAEPTKVRQVLSQMRLAGRNSCTLYQAPNISGAGGRLNVPTAQDAIILKGDEKQIESMMEVIKQIDVPPLLIKVNMKVIEFSLTDNKNMGFNWRMGPVGAMSKGNISFNFQEKNFQGEETFQGFARKDEFEYSTTVNFLLDKGLAKILADSTLTVTNGGRGTFFVGETIPYRSTFQVSDFGRVTQRIQQENVGINMSFKAQAADDDTITLYLDPDLSNLKEITDIGPRTSKKNFTTTVRIKTGQPYAIGGLINESDRVTYDKVPFLGDLPLLGKFFKAKSKQLNRSELVVVFTPEIVRDSAIYKYEKELENLGLESLGSSSPTFSLTK